MKKREKKGRISKSPRPKVQPSGAEAISSHLAALPQKIGEWRHTAIVLGAAYFVIASFISFQYHKILDYGMESDFLFEYVPIAREVSKGSLPIGQFRGPVYPILLAVAKPIVGDYFKAGLFIGLIAAAITVALSFKLVRRLFDGKVALAAALLLMVNPYFFMYSYQVGTDMVFVALVTASLYCLLAGAKLDWKLLSASAVLGALAYLTRYNGIFILAVPALLLLSNQWRLSWKHRLLTAALFAAVFFICVAPWGFYCLKEKGSFFYSENRLNIAFDIYAKDQMSREEFFWKGNPFEGMSIPEIALHKPDVFFGALVKNFWDHGLKISEFLLRWPLSVLALAGTALLLFRKTTARQGNYLLLNLAFFMMLLPIHFEIRYPVFLLGGLLTVAACGIFLWGVKVGKGLRTVSVVVLVALAIYTGFNSYEINRRHIDAGPKEILVIADQFKANVPPEKRGTIVAARKPHIAFHTGLEYVPLPLVNSPEELIQELKSREVDYLYFGSVEYSTRPGLRNLIDQTRSWPGLRPIASSNDPVSVLYEVE